MEEKIRKYVNYQFRFEKGEDIEDVKNEIIANLIDRYYEKVKSGKEPDEAYIDAIKSMGDFSEKTINDIPKEYSVKPSIYDILLLSGAILSIFGLILTLFNVIVGTIFTALSIMLFSGAAYYLYSYSQYVKKECMDIDEHHLILDKIYKYMKSSFIFWAISLSLILTAIVMDFITWIAVLNHGASINSVGDMITGFNSIDDYVAAYILTFIITLIIFLIISKNIYDKLMYRYYILTGKNYLKGKLRESYELLYGDYKRKHQKSLIISKRFLPILASIIIIYHLFMSFNWATGWDGEGWIGYESYTYIGGLLKLFSTRYLIISIIPLFTLIINIIVIILSFMNRIKKQFLLIVSVYTWLISSIIVIPLANSKDLLLATKGTGKYGFFMTILFTVIIIIRGIIHFKQSRNKEIS